jgi:hypothetical protein
VLEKSSDDNFYITSATVHYPETTDPELRDGIFICKENATQSLIQQLNLNTMKATTLFSNHSTGPGWNGFVFDRSIRNSRIVYLHDSFNVIYKLDLTMGKKEMIHSLGPGNRVIGNTSMICDTNGMLIFLVNSNEIKVLNPHTSHCSQMWSPFDLSDTMSPGRCDLRGFIFNPHDTSSMYAASYIGDIWKIPIVEYARSD